MGADAIGYTLYAGSPRQDLDIQQLREMRDECEKYAMPLIVWSWRLAFEFGADIVKLNVPRHGEKDSEQPRPSNTLEWTEEEGVRASCRTRTSWPRSTWPWMRAPPA